MSISTNRLTGITFAACVAGAVLAPAAVFAHDVGDRPGRPVLTEEQQTCLEQHGVPRPDPAAGDERPRPTVEQREAFRAAAEACGIRLRAFGHGGRPFRRLTDEQRTCLEGQGIERPQKPADGQEPTRPSAEQRERFRAAAEACGIELPPRPADRDEVPAPS